MPVVFGPQHGIWGHTQDNMVEWQDYFDSRFGVRFVSLYGDSREPNQVLLRDLDLLVIDLPDVGARYYTFVWTLASCMKVCSETGTKVLVLDRPNPINGATVEGPVLDPVYASFVGLYPLPIRHGMTMGEIAHYLKSRYFPKVELEVIACEGWDRRVFLDETDLPWAMPSPNMPAISTALVYPGQCLLEGTSISEGRGTTRPFEVFGAPKIDGWVLAEQLNQCGLAGAHFRPYAFEPTFQKHAKQLCEGCFLHVTDRNLFQPFETSVTILKTLLSLFPEVFAWKQPPYEYEYEKLPIDILVGNCWTRQGIETGETVRAMADRWADEVESFNRTWREPSLIYA